MKHYDYIFTGAGCAGLSLLTRMKAAGLTRGKRILLIDKSTKNENDRTWCFWEDQPGYFEPIVYKQWADIWFHSETFSQQFSIAPYRYKMIRGIDFYNHCLAQLQQDPGIEIMQGSISEMNGTDGLFQFTINGQQHSYRDAIVFNSLLTETMWQQKAVYLLQHFKGWIIETPEPFFNPAEATLMDFRVGQHNGTSFVYVLPLSATRALVEYTVFSEKILTDDAYDTGLATYLHNNLKLQQYRIDAAEFGVIPMTNAKFPWYANGMYHIGTAGGQTKASSGYTFQFIQKQSAAIVQQLLHNTFGPQSKPAAAARRFHFYDAILLQVIASKYAHGSRVFTDLFKKNSPQSIFAFLDNESSVAADLRIIQSLPVLPFLKAAGKQLLSR